jgi:hypothetical protein
MTEKHGCGQAHSRPAGDHQSGGKLLDKDVIFFQNLFFSAVFPIRIRIGSGFNQVSRSISRRAKMTPKKRKKLRIFMF